MCWCKDTRRRRWECMGYTLLTDEMAQAASSSSSTHNKNKQRSGLEGVDLAALHFLFDEMEVVGVEKAGLVDVVLIELS